MHDYFHTPIARSYHITLLYEKLCPGRTKARCHNETMNCRFAFKLLTRSFFSELQEEVLKVLMMVLRMDMGMSIQHKPPIVVAHSNVADDLSLLSDKDSSISLQINLLIFP